MYKHQSGRLQHETRLELRVDSCAEIRIPISKPGTSRRSSDPITIFSAHESERSAHAAIKGILPGHIGGVFAGVVDDALSQQHTGAHDRPAQRHRINQPSVTDTATSLGNALEEVLDSVDAANEIHHRRRSNSRIQDWLGHQKQAQFDCALEEQEQERRNKARAEQIIRKLLCLDPSIFEILFRRVGSDRASTMAAKAVQLKIWERWAHLSERDTESLITQTGKSTRSEASKANGVDGVPKPSTRVGNLERIPWGIPEEQLQETTYWNEDFSLTMIFKYLKSHFARRSSALSDSAGEPKETEERAQKHVKTAQSAATSNSNAGSTITDRRSAATTSASPAARQMPSTSREASTRISSHLRQARHDRNRSRTSRSSSYHTVSLRTGSCSVASIRRSTLGSNFWDLRSLGGRSATSLDIGGNWAVYA